MGLRTRVLACSAALAAVILMVVPASRSFASTVAGKIVHLRPGGIAGPIPFILDLHKHKRAQKPPSAPRHTAPGNGQPSSPKSHASTASRSPAHSR